MTVNANLTADLRHCTLSIAGTLFLIDQQGASPLPFRSGTYVGLFYETNAVSLETSGYFKLAATSRRSYSAMLWLNRRKYSMRGRFDAAGWATNVIGRSGLTPLSVTWALDASDADFVTGTVRSSNWIAVLEGDRAQFSSKTNPAPQVGRYTLAIASALGGDDSPEGCSIGTLLVHSNGLLSLTARLADGAVVSQRSVVSKRGDWPLHVAGREFLLGWVAFRNHPEDDLRGRIHWAKAPSATGRYYPAGFTVETNLSGWRYEKPGRGERVLDMSDGLLALAGACLSLTSRVMLLPNNKVNSPGPAKLKDGMIYPTTGLFSGTFTPAGTRAKYKLWGVALQKSNSVTGFYLCPMESGKLSITPDQ